MKKFVVKVRTVKLRSPISKKLELRSPIRKTHKEFGI